MVDVAAKDVNASEFLDESCLEAGPVGDGVEGASFVQWDGLESENKFGRVVASSEVESVEDRGQPGIEIIGQSTPVVSDKFGLLETGRRWWNRRGRDWTVWWRGGL